MRYLNVAEKPSVAKSISHILSQGNLRNRAGQSKYNPVYEFSCRVRNVDHCQMIFTSLSGHIMELDFDGDVGTSNWQSYPPSLLFTAPVIKRISKNSEPIRKTLEQEVAKVDGLILWLDCDREGENIAYEVIDVCKRRKPNISIMRIPFLDFETFVSRSSFFCYHSTRHFPCVEHPHGPFSARFPSRRRSFRDRSSHWLCIHTISDFIVKSMLSLQSTPHENSFPAPTTIL